MSNHGKAFPEVLLLAAGLGTRLRPLTDHLPKCLMPINGHPLLFYWLEQLRSLGCERCYVNLHYYAELVREVVNCSPYKDMVSFIEEPTLLGTAGTVREGYQFFQNKPLWLIHADNLSTGNWRGFIETYYQDVEPGSLLMHTFVTDHPQSCGVVELEVENGRNRVVCFHEKVQRPPSNLANGAVYLLTPQLVEVIANDPNISDFSTEVLPRQVGQMVTWQTDGYHRDIGRWQSYVTAQREFRASWQPATSEGWKSWWRQQDNVAKWKLALSQCEMASTVDALQIKESKVAL